MFKNKRINLLLILILSLTVVLSACSKENPAEDKQVKEDVVDKESEDTDKSDTTEDESDKKKLVIGTSREHAPWAYQDEEALKGFDIAIWEEIGNRNDYKVEYKLSKLSGLRSLFDRKQIDSIAHQVSITEDASEKYIFTEPYAYTYYDFVVKKDSDINNLQDLKGKTVGCLLEGNAESTLRKINEEHDLNLQIITYDEGPLEAEVEENRIDALWQVEVNTKYAIDQQDEDEECLLRFLGERLAFEENAYPFNKDGDNIELIDEINKTIEEMREDGTIKKLSEEWFGVDISHKDE